MFRTLGRRVGTLRQGRPNAPASGITVGQCSSFPPSRSERKVVSTVGRVEAHCAGVSVSDAWPRVFPASGAIVCSSKRSSRIESIHRKGRSRSAPLWGADGSRPARGTTDREDRHRVRYDRQATGECRPAGPQFTVTCLLRRIPGSARLISGSSDRETVKSGVNR